MEVVVTERGGVVIRKYGGIEVRLRRRHRRRGDLKKR
jgi:hypothetical protein